MKKIILSLALLLALLTLLGVSASAADLPLIYDEAELLNDFDEAALKATLESVSSQYDMDVAVVTIDSLEAYGYTGYDAPMNFADDYFDYNGFGRGENRDGLVLLLAMESRDWWISTRGRAIRVFTDYGINEYIKNNIIDYLSSGDYAKAFTEYANSAAALIEFEKTHGEPYDYDSAKEPVKPFSFGRLVGSLLAGLGAAFVPVSGMKSKLKTVRNQYGARNYAKENSLRVTTANDFFIGRHVSRTAIERSSSSGGSSTHVSSSGATHGGGGGKF